MARRHKVVDVDLPRADAHVSNATTDAHDIDRRIGVDDLRWPDERRRERQRRNGVVGTVRLQPSDYPHPEGGRDPMGDISGKLARLGSDVLRKVFVENAAWLLPD